MHDHAIPSRILPHYYGKRPCHLCYTVMLYKLQVSDQILWYMWQCSDVAIRESVDSTLYVGMALTRNICNT